MPVIPPERLQERVASFPETHAAVNTVSVTLTEGRVFSGVEVAWAREAIRVPGYAEVPFTAAEIVDLDDNSGLY